MRDIDQARWPGRGRDGPLYDIARPTRSTRAAAPVTAVAPRDALADLTWPELALALRAGRDTAVVPLGATEQHGPHLPFATDTWIADALAERFCARVRRPCACRRYRSDAPPSTMGSPAR